LAATTRRLAFGVEPGATEAQAVGRRPREIPKTGRRGHQSSRGHAEASKDDVPRAGNSRENHVAPESARIQRPVHLDQAGSKGDYVPLEGRDPLPPIPVGVKDEGHRLRGLGRRGPMAASRASTSNRVSQRDPLREVIDPSYKVNGQESGGRPPSSARSLHRDRISASRSPRPSRGSPPSPRSTSPGGPRGNSPRGTPRSSSPRARSTTS